MTFVWLILKITYFLNFPSFFEYELLIFWRRISVIWEVVVNHLRETHVIFGGLTEIILFFSLLSTSLTCFSLRDTAWWAFIAKDVTWEGTQDHDWAWGFNSRSATSHTASSDHRCSILHSPARADSHSSTQSPHPMLTFWVAYLLVAEMIAQ